MQKYQQEIFQELRQKDELVVIARGLGLLRLVTNLLHSYDAAGNNLILLVGAEDRENGWIGEALAEHAAISMAPRARGLSVVNTDVMSVGTREKMYSQGGIFSVTSRILVVDLLTSLLNPETITGLVVLHADRIVATSLEAFILRIYRQRNKVGFLKAFSDNPEPFATGFSPLSTMMRNLFLRNVSLWPRFQVTVGQALEGKKKAGSPWSWRGWVLAFVSVLEEACFAVCSVAAPGAWLSVSSGPAGILVDIGESNLNFSTNL